MNATKSIESLNIELATSADNFDNLINAVKKYSGMSAITKAMGGSLIPVNYNNLSTGKLNQLAESLSTLDKKQREAALSAISLDEVSKKRLATNANLLADGKLIRTSLIQQELSVVGLTKAEQNEIMQKAGLISSTGQLNILTEARIRQNIIAAQATGKLTAAESAQLMTSLADAKAKQLQAQGVRELTAAHTALNGVMLIGKQILMSFAMMAVVSGIQFLIEKVKEAHVTYEEFTDMAAQSSESYKEQEKKVEDLKKKIEELTAAKNGSSRTHAVSDEELKKLETQRKIEEQLLAIRAAEANQNVKGTFDTKGNKAEFNTYDDYGNQTGKSSVKMNDLDYLEFSSNRYKETLEKIDNIQAEFASNTDATAAEVAEYESKIASLTEESEKYHKAVVETADAINNNFNKAINDESAEYKELAEYSDRATQIADEHFELYGEGADAVDESTKALDKQVMTLDDIKEKYSELASSIDSIQEGYSNLYKAASEYNEHGTISMDTLQGLMGLDMKYLSCLEMENGQLKVNVDTFRELAIARLEDAKATAIDQAMTELSNVTAVDEATTAYDSMQALAEKSEIVALLSQTYGSLGESAAFAAKAQALAEAYSNAASKNAEEANRIMSGLDKTIAAIDNTIAGMRKSTKSADAALRGYNETSKEAKSAQEKLKKSLEATKDAIEAEKDALEKEEKKLKAWGEAAVKELEKRKEALESQKEAQTKLYEDEIEKLEELKDAQSKVYEEQIEALEEKKDALQKANDEEDRAIKLAELQEALERAKSAKTVRVYSHQTGFEWRANENDVTSAQEALDDQNREWQREDAISSIESEIDAIEKLKEAYEESTDAQIEAIEKKKEAYEESIDAEIEKIEAMKDKYQEVLDIIGMGWEEYQLSLQMAQEFSGMSLDAMGNHLSTFKDNVVNNLQQMADVETRLKEVTDQLSGLETSTDGGGGGGSFATLTESAEKASVSFSDLRTKVAALADRNAELAKEEMLLNDLICDGMLNSEQYKSALQRLSEVKAEENDNTLKIIDTSKEYTDAIIEEESMTSEAKQKEMDKLIELLESYGTNYEGIALLLDGYVEHLGGTQVENATKLSLMGDAFGTLKTTIGKETEQMKGYIASVTAALSEMIRKANEAVAAMNNPDYKAYLNRAGGRATGTRRNAHAGVYQIDEEGSEAILRSKNGRYTYLEKDDQVLPASYTNNLWSMASNPSEWFARQYEKYGKNATANTIVRSGDSYTSSIGDIVINQPVGDVDALSRAIRRDMPNAVLRSISRR